MALVFVGVGAILLGAVVARRRRRPRVAAPSCVDSHDEAGLNYPWLRGVYGGLAFIEFEEPPGSGGWRRYTRAVWAAHCQVVSHDPETLAADHVRAFVDPATRFARLRFHFQDGTVQEPTAQLYELEAAWFRVQARATLA